MKTLLYLSIIAVSLLSQDAARAQFFGLHPYAVISTNQPSSHSPGFGGDIGFRYRFIYAGVEYGSVGRPIPDEVFMPAREASYYSEESVSYLAIHAGAIVFNKLWVGVGALKLHGKGYNVKLDSMGRENGSTPQPRTAYELAFDLRWLFGNHFLLNGALSDERGLKLGFGVML